MTSAYTIQQRFAFGDDDGSESAHSLDTENANRTAQIADVTILIRIQTQETNGKVDPWTYQLYAAKNGGSYVAVTRARADGLRLADDTQSRADAEATTERLTAGTGTFVSGEYDDGGTEDGMSGNITLNGEYTDLEFAIEIDSANALDTDYWDLQAYSNAGTALDNYSVTPRVIADIPAADVDVYPAAVAAGADSVTPTVRLSSVSVSPSAVAAGADSVDPFIFPFSDGFETGDVSRWHGSSGSPTINGAAALVGSYGFEMAYNDTFTYTSLSWINTTQQTYRIKFKIDINNLAGADSDIHDIFEITDGAQYVGFLLLRWTGSAIAIRVSMLDNATTGYNSDTVVTGEHEIEVEWVFEDTTGHMDWWIDGVPQSSITGLDAGDWYPDGAKFGNGYSQGSPFDSGSFYLDDFTIYDTQRPADVNVTPQAVAAGAGSVDPTIQLGSISYAPTLVAAGADSTDPITQLGDIDFTPTVVVAGADSIDPSVQQDSINITPAILTSGADSIDPTVQIGGLNITPAVAVAGADSIDPTVEAGGDTNVYPAAVTASADSISPIVTPYIFGDVIQSGENSSSGQTSISVVLSSAITEGSLLLVFHFTGDANSIGPSGWGEAFALTNAVELDEGAIYYKIAGASESTTITCTSDLADENMLIVMEVEGPWEVSPLDKIAETGRSGGESISTGTTETTSQADEFAAALVIFRDPNETFSWTNSFVNRGESTSEHKTLGAATKLLTSTQTVESTASWTGSDTALAGVATFKKQGGISVSPAASSAGADSTVAEVRIGTVTITPAVSSAGSDSVDPTTQLGSVSITPVEGAPGLVLNPIRPRLIDPPVSQFGINRKSPQADGLVGWWPTAADIGSVLRDFSGYRNHGSFPGGSDDPSRVSSNIGSVLEYDGSDYINAGNSSLHAFTGDFSVAFWVNPTSVGDNNTIISKGAWQSDGFYIHWENDAQGTREIKSVVSEASFGYETRGNTTLDLGKWHHVVFVRQGIQGRLYYNGIEETSYQQQVSIDGMGAASRNLYFMRYDSAGYESTGKLGDVRLYDYPIPDSLIYQLYANQTRYDLYSPVFRQYWVVGGTGVGAATARTASIDPTVDISAVGVNVYPDAVAAGADSVDPSVEYGSLSATPSASAAGADSVDPSVQLGSLNITPSVADAGSDSISPSVQQDSLNITPSVLSAGADSVIDEVRQGSLSLSPTLADASAVSVAPSVEQDSMGVTPTAADASVVSIDPTVQIGSPPVYPDPAVAGADSIDPTVRQGSISVTPVVAPAGADSVDPSITLSSISVTPDVAAAGADSIDPTVQLTGGGENVYPVAAEAGADSVIGEIRQSSMSVSPTLVDASAVGVDPSVEHGDIDLTPAVAAAGTDSFHEETKQSSISFTPAVVSASAESVDPTTHQGDLDLSPAVSTAATSGIDPAITLSSVSVSPAAGSAGASTVNPLISISGGNFVAVSWARIRIPASGINVTPRPASARTDTSGNVKVTIQANSAFIAVTIPTVTLVQVHILTASDSVVNVTSDTVLLAQEHKLLVHRAVIVVTSTTVELGFPTLYPLIKDGAVNSEMSEDLEVNSVIMGVGNVTSRVIVDGEVNSRVSADLEITERLEVPNGS